MPSMLKNPEAAKDATVDDLRHTLLTCDGAGVRTKSAALDELLRRAEVYIPSVTRREPPRVTVVFTIGIETHPGEFGMIEGPYPTESEALRSAQTNDRARIIRHDDAHGSSRVLWRWSSDRWVRVAT